MTKHLCYSCRYWDHCGYMLGLDKTREIPLGHCVITVGGQTMVRGMTAGFFTCSAHKPRPEPSGVPIVLQGEPDPDGVWLEPADEGSGP